VNEQALIDYVTAQRWFGSKTQSVSHASVIDEATVRELDPPLTLALAEIRFETGRHETYQLFLAGEELDALREPAGARELVHAIRGGLTVQAREGVVEFRPVAGFGGLGTELRSARPIESEQSNTSVVFDDELILKVFRRLEAGINPELELLRFLTERDFPNIAALGGWFAYSGKPIDATLGILQRYVRDGRDGWELALEELAAAPDAFIGRLRRLGEVTGSMHTMLGSEPADSSFCPETPSAETLGLLSATIDEEPLHNTFWWPLGLTAGAGVLAGMLGLRGRRLTAMALGATAFAAAVDDLPPRSRRFRGLLPKRQATNVIATLGPEDAERTVVVVAHHDAAPTGKIFDDRLQVWLGETFPGVLERMDTSLPLWWMMLSAPALVATGSARGRRGMIAAGLGLSVLGAATMEDVARSPIVPAIATRCCPRL